jgi:hypothetical protein
MLPIYITVLQSLWSQSQKNGTRIVVRFTHTHTQEAVGTRDIKHTLQYKTHLVVLICIARE